MNFFSMDNLFFRTVGKLVDLVWLNILTLVFALPVVTIGASFSAMYSVLLKLVRNEEGSITAGFFNAFKNNFKSSTLTWLVALPILLVCCANLWLLRQGVMGQLPTLEKMSGVGILLIILIVVAILSYMLPLLARYDQNLKVTFKNAVLLAIASLPSTVSMLIIGIFPIALMTLSDYFLWLWWLYGLTFPGYLNAMLLMRIFDKTQGE
ncbi:MAG: YesL family protein [Pseudobutyrivibrio sp.]|nr:YesL family protein [Pseudobutyrivibrio sp.]